MSKLVLDIRNDDGCIARIRITGIMCYPDNKPDNRKRTDWMLRSILKLVEERSKESTAAYGGLDIEFEEKLGNWLTQNVCDYGGWLEFARVCIGPGQKKPLIDYTRERSEGGIWAGSLLDYTLNIPDSAKNIGIATAAKYFCSPEVRKQFKAAGREPFGNPERGAKESPGRYLSEKLWPQFKPAAHLWVAYCNAASSLSDKLPTSSPWLPLHKLVPGGLKGFLELAEDIRQKAAKKMTKPGSPKPIIPLEDSWQILY